MTPFLKNVIIIASLFIAIFVVVIVIYNIISFGAEEKEREALVDLNIIKNSVSVGEEILELSINGDVGEEELRKVRFIISDGANEKEINFDASDFDKEKKFEINLKDLGIDPTKKLSVSIRPIIKDLLKDKVLGVTDKISISPDGKVKKEIVESGEGIDVISISKCNKCGGSFGSDKCSKTKCHSILEGSIKCFYEGGWRRTCTICTDITCGDYETEDECETDRCKVDCEWGSSNEKCFSTGCGNGIVNEGEACDDGIENGNYGYCNSDCSAISASCGDNTCNSDYETYDDCPSDCPLCTEGQTQQCGITDVGECEYGVQTCGADNIWGDCVGDVGISAELCDGLDNDCDGENDDDLVAPNADKTDGVCVGSKKVCGGISGWQEPNYGLISDYEAIELSCFDVKDNDCDDNVDFDDSDCSCPEGEIYCSGSCDVPVCNDASDCDDSVSCTIDTCDNGGTCSASCSNTPIVSCVDGDGCCAPGCNVGNDNDCGVSCGDTVCSGEEDCSSCPGDCGACLGETCNDAGDCEADYCYVDSDGDRYAPSSGTKTCRASSQLGGVDCDDGDGTIFQLLSCYTDSDNDNYGTGDSSQVCSGVSCGTGWASQSGDCLDSDGAVRPNAGYHSTIHAIVGWDWDCSGGTNKESSTCNDCTSCVCSGTCSTCPGYPSSTATASCSDTAASCGVTYSPNSCIYSQAWDGCVAGHSGYFDYSGSRTACGNGIVNCRLGSISGSQTCRCK